MNRQRFSKKTLVETIRDEADRLYERWGFTWKTGTAQLKGKQEDIDRAVAYGYIDALRDLADELEGK